MFVRLRSICVVVFAAFLVVVMSVWAQAFTPTRAIKECSTTRIKPHRFTILQSCWADSGIYARHSVWRYWDRKKFGDRWAKAKTKIYIDNCDPNCAGGHFHHRAARVWLTGRDWCKTVHRYVYKVQHIVYTGPDKGIGPNVRRWPHGWHVLGCPPPSP
jgi:hypothetical protein